MEHTVHLAHAFASILHKEDDVWQQQRIEIRACQIVIDREVASNDDALSPTLDIQRMRRHSVGWQITLKHATQSLANGIVALVSLQRMTHRPMNALHPYPRLSTEQSRDVAEANDKLRILAKGIERETRKQMSSPISPTRTHDSLNAWFS